jgi:CO dehydrogenase nickel-insertion accessory protein CooC1
LLGQLESDDRIVIADMEAGAGTLTRMAQGSLDVAVLVVEPSAKSIDVARRAAAVMRERKIGMLVVAANRLRSEADFDLIRSALPGVEILTVPDEPAIAQADRDARSPIRHPCSDRCSKRIGCIGQWNAYDRVASAEDTRVIELKAADEGCTGW